VIAFVLKEKLILRVPWYLKTWCSLVKL
jgi:hypothetical protein